MSGLLRHLDRFGGVLVRPAATLRAVLWDRVGSLWEIAAWMVLVTAAIAPEPTGRALLVGRVRVMDGVSAYLSVFAERMAAPLIGVMVAGSLLHLWDRSRGENKAGLGFDGAVDACGYLLVPFLGLAAMGAALSALGAEFWFMPHRALKGPTWAVAIRVAVAFGWSAVLFGVLAREVRNGPPRSEHAGSL